MTRYERLKEKQRAALIVVLTFGLVNVPFLKVWRNSLFEGTSFEKKLNSSHKCNRPSHLRNYDPKFNKSIFLGSQIA